MKNKLIKFKLNGLETEMTTLDAQKFFISLLHQEESSWIDFPIKIPQIGLKDYSQFWRIYSKNQEPELLTADDLKTINNKDITTALPENKINYYVSVNGFSEKEFKNKHGYWTKSRCESNCTNINGIFLDFDFHRLSIDKIENSISKLLNFLNDKIENNIILKPTIINITGRGLALFYIYDQSSFQFDDKFKKFHKNLTDRLMTYFQNLIDVDIEDVDIDKSVNSLDKICRLPFTFNSSTNSYSSIYSADEILYDPTYIYEYFKLDNIVTTTITTKIKNSKKNKLKATNNNNVENLNIYELLKFKNEKYYCIPPQYRAIVKARIKILDKYIENEGFERDEGSGRNNLIFLYFNFAISIYGHNAGLLKTIEYNNKLGEPLSNNEFTNIIQYTVKHSKQSSPYIIWNNNTFIDLAGFTDNDIQTYEILKNQQIKEERRRKHQERVLQDKLICKTALEHTDLTYSEISNYLLTNHNIKICRKTVERHLNAHGINKTNRCDIKYEDIDFDLNEIYKHKSKKYVSINEFLSGLSNS